VRVGDAAKAALRPKSTFGAGADELFPCRRRKITRRRRLARATSGASTMYIAGFVIPAPEGKMEAYRQWAKNGAKIFKEFGCIEIVES
jgi:hypothetical protein